MKSRTVLEGKLTKLVSEADSTEKERTELGEQLLSLDLKLRHFEDRCVCVCLWTHMYVL
jgi:hypothetical protein